MNKEHTTFLVKNIPTDVWKKLKMRNISENDENINDIMLKLINSYVKKGDAIIKSPVNQFDTFPTTGLLETSINDGDNIIKLETYAKIITQLKKQKRDKDRIPKLLISLKKKLNLKEELNLIESYDISHHSEALI